MFRKMALETLGCFGRRAAGLLELDADTEAECRKWGGSQTASLEALISFLFMASEEKKIPNADIFSSHSLLDYE